MATKTGTGLEYKGVASISGPIIIVENVQNVGYDELVSVKTQNGETRLGKVVQIYTESRIRSSFRRHNRFITFRNTHPLPWALFRSSSVN